MSSRALIMARLQNRRAGDAGPADLPRAAAEDFGDNFARFAGLAEQTQMTAEQVVGPREIAAAVSRYLAREGLGMNIVVDSSLKITGDEFKAAGLSVKAGAIGSDGDTYLASGLAAIAECGAVVLTSGPGRPLQNDFLARTHIVVVPAERVVPAFADFWRMLRADMAAGRLQREYCLVTGPSRTADLGVPAKLGAHGPARVHVIVSADKAIK